MKTRLQILEDDHDSALAQSIENEINILSLKERAKELEPGKEFDQVQATIVAKKTNEKNIKRVLGIIVNLIKKEKEE